MLVKNYAVLYNVREGNEQHGSGAADEKKRYQLER